MLDVAHTLPVRLLLKRWSQWLDRRVTPSRKVILDQKRIFIFPTREGGFFILVIIGLFFGGVNYENSLILAMSFFLSGLLLVCVYQTYRNFSGLHVEASHVAASFAGGKARFCINLSRAGHRTYEAIGLSWPNTMMQYCCLVQEEEANVILELDTLQRGWFTPGRTKIQTVFPLGLIRAWSWVDLDFKCLVYPKPIEHPLLQNTAFSEHGGKSTSVSGVDDFEALRVYRSGDPLKHVHWKMLARNDQLYSKSFTAEQEENQWLDWDSFAQVDVELRLSYLCFAVLELSSAGVIFGLRMPGGDIKPNSGETHKERCLAALALF